MGSAESAAALAGDGSTRGSSVPTAPLHCLSENRGNASKLRVWVGQEVWGGRGETVWKASVRAGEQRDSVNTV